MAFLKGSFYENLRRFAASEEGALPFKGVRARRLATPEPVLEHTVALKERPDSLAQHYYADPRAWRWIADTNPEAIFFEDMLHDPEPGEESERLGAVILIPRRRETR
jgi:hypothetical protein